MACSGKQTIIVSLTIVVIIAVIIISLFSTADNLARQLTYYFYQQTIINVIIPILPVRDRKI